MLEGLGETRAAKGRSTQMAAGAGMTRLLLVMLTGLTGGLGAQNTAGLDDLNPERYVFGNAQVDEAPEDPTFAESSVTSADQSEWAETTGVEEAVPVGMSQTLLTGDSSG